MSLDIFIYIYIFKHIFYNIYNVMCLKDLVRKWEVYCGEHQQYKSNIEDFNKWLLTAQQKLDDLHQTGGTKEDLESRLNKVKVRLLK